MIPFKPLPRSFAAGGFVSADVAVRMGPRNVARRFRRFMLGSDGIYDSGKTEFALSSPEPIIVIALDRNFDSLLSNPNPPPSRMTQVGFRVIAAPTATQLQTPKMYEEYWNAFYLDYMNALNNEDARTVVLDGDSDSWELQQLAAFGRVVQVPQLSRYPVYAARRAMINRAWDSGKIVISTNKVKEQYAKVLDAEGVPKRDEGGREITEKTGELEGQGFRDRGFLWSTWIRHLYKPATNKRPPQWGLRITKCKPNKELEGLELWGTDCNMPSLLQVIYPNTSLGEWGY